FADGTVRPGATITRAQVATIFFRLMSDADRAAFWRQDNPYSDVEFTSWYNNAVSTVSNFGLFRGGPDGTFQPHRAVTRAELAAVLARFKDISYSESTQFNDIDGHWAQGYINAAAFHRWVRGIDGSGGAFLPDQPVTRAEAAAMINRALNRLPEGTQDLLSDMRAWPDNANQNTWYYLYIQEATNSHYYVMKADGIHEMWVQIVLPERPWHLLERPDSRPQNIFRAG
ncbi:MAG: S-layer homology domain-containing protein, partial [Oscillospiraceae bacterium]|nr:S-layer homology domain-containing protein [Oscillospiraceae bacterium]